jgi:hypothetical protein
MGFDTCATDLPRSAALQEELTVTPINIAKAK